MADQNVKKLVEDTTREILAELNGISKAVHEFVLYVPSCELTADQLALAQTFIAADLDTKTSIQIIRIEGQIHHPRTAQVLTRVRVVRRV